METARSSSLHCRLVDTGAELKLKPFGSQNSQVSIGNPPLLPTPKVRQPNLFKEKGLRVSGAASGRCTKRYPSPPPPSPPPPQAGRSGHNSAAPRAQPAPEPLQLRCAGLKRVGRGRCAPKLAFLAAKILGSQLQGPRHRDTAGRATEAVGRAESG